MARPNVSPNPPPVVSADDKAKIISALSTDTGSTIRTRLAKLQPSIKLENHIVFNDKFKVEPTTLEGISFEPVNCHDLYNQIDSAREAKGERSFTDPEKVNRDHLPLKLSMLATKGTGFREIWRAFPKEPIVFKPQHQPWQKPQIDLGFGSQFGARPIKLDITSLHWAVSPEICNIHIDQGGFTIQVDDDLIVDPDSVQHILDELLLHDKLQGALPEKLKKVVRRITLIYPSTANGFSRWGPAIDSTPILKKIAELPGVGGVIGRVHLPGVSFEAWKGRNFKVSLTYSCGVTGGGCSETVSVDGTF